LERLNEGLSSGRRLILISAPAGFGKTTLVSEWIPGCGKSVAWLSLDGGDNDLSRFLTYLISALQTLPPKFGGVKIGAGVLGVLQSPQPSPIESILIALLNEIATVPDHFVLVLDDYHLIDSKPVDEALTFLLDHLPPQMHLVITTREDPGLPLARLRARGQLTELRAADLRFTSSEATEFLNQVMGLNLSAEDTSILENRAEGWVAGLQLAALSMQGREDVASFIRAFAGDHRYIVDYLVEEVIQRQPEPVRSFLLQTAILDRLNGSLCDAITGQEESNSRLEALERGNFFVVPLDDKRDWYRYHHLFADVLRVRLKIEHPDQVSALHQRASEWYEHNGSAADAIRHALAAKDFERAAGLIELAVPEMRRNRQGATVTELGWLKALPDELVRCRPVLSVAYAFALFGGGEPGGVEPRLRDAERWLDTSDLADSMDPLDPQDPKADIRAQPESPTAGPVIVDAEEFRRLPGMIALLRAALALARGDMPEAEKNARRVLDRAPEGAHLVLGGAASVLGLAAWASGNLKVARQMTADGMLNVRRAGYISSAIGGAIVLADIQIAQGHLREAMITYERALQWATEPGTPVQRGAADMYVGMSDLHLEHNDLNTATQHLLTSRALGELAGSPQNPYRWCAAMARIREAQGDLNGALDFLDQAEHLYNGAFSPNVRPIATRKIRVWVTQGRLGEALGWVRAQGLSVDNDLSYLQEFDHITLARVLLACYRNDSDGSISEVMRLLERLLKAAEERGGIGSMIEILVLQALALQAIAFHAQGDLPAALLPLKRALALAEAGGYVRMFLDEGASMLQLLREASACVIMPLQGLPTYIDKLLAAFESENRKSADKPDLLPAETLIEAEARPANSMLVEPLSQRELEILKLIAQGLSNREIGERLFLALDTVKGHNRNIFDKLQVLRRTEAVARARELGLLQA
jgi:LuxR family maltose regulon positive regulatory protein